MAITQEFLSQCTDEQINKGVAWLEAKSDSISNPSSLFEQTIHGVFRFCDEFNPCINPNDIMPIAIANDIEFVRRRGVGDRREFIASKNLINGVNENPYRAICEVYILMMVAK